MPGYRRRDRGRCSASEAQPHDPYARIIVSINVLEVCNGKS